MKQMIKIIRRVDMEKKQKDMLFLEQDYELASLHQAMETSNEVEKIKSLKRLEEISSELESLGV